jgi:hypothetical protein
MEVKAALKTVHRDDATATLYACRFFQLNDAGQTQEGLKFMAEPIGSYYRIYKNRSVSQRDADLISFIEQLASTNQIIAAEIYKKKN